MSEEIPAGFHRHPNGGGLVADTAIVESTVFVGPDAHVYGDAQVSGDARVYGNAQVSGDARVYGNANVYGNAQVSGDARVYGNANVYGKARVYGNAQVYGEALVSDSTSIVQGKLGLHHWNAHQDSQHGTVLRFGCECHPLSDWPKLYRKLSQKHEPGNVDYYADGIKAIAALCRVALDPNKAESQ